MNKSFDTFEEFLEDKFMEDFTGTKDQCEDALDNWFSNLDVQYLIDMGELWGQKCYLDGKEYVIKQMEPHISALDLNLFANEVEKDVK